VVIETEVTNLTIDEVFEQPPIDHGALIHGLYLQVCNKNERCHLSRHGSPTAFWLRSVVFCVDSL
jgi:hypothetical protein